MSYRHWVTSSYKVWLKSDNWVLYQTHPGHITWLIYYLQLTVISSWPDIHMIFCSVLSVSENIKPQTPTSIKAVGGGYVCVVYCQQQQQHIVNGLETTSCHFVKDPSNNIKKMSRETPGITSCALSVHKHQIFICQSSYVCERKKERLSHYSDCGIMQLFQLLFFFLGLLHRFEASSAGPAAVYYSPDLICLTDDWATLNPC